MTRSVLLMSVAPFALIAAPAFGQAATPQEVSEAQQPDASIEDQAPVAQEQATASAAGRSPGTQSTENLQGNTDPRDIVVTGYRASLGSAQRIKRESDAILDAIVAQDIGKLPDNTAAESLARITGVQVNRYSDEVNQVLVRGLPDIATTVNGRDVFTAELRRVQMQDFPAGALAGLEVYKSGTADLLEPGLAGLVNVRTRRPFDFTDGFTVAGGIRGTYNDQSGKYDPLGNILISQRAETSIGEIGWLINASYAQSQYRNAVRYASGNVPASLGNNTTVIPTSVGRAFRVPEAVGVFNDSGRRWRPAVNASVQWKPTDNLEIYYDFLYQGFRGRSANDQFNTSLLGSPAAVNPIAGSNPTLTNIVLSEEHPDQVKSLTKLGGIRPDMYRSTGAGYTNTYQAAGGMKWNVGRARLSTDLAYTRSEYGSNAWSFDAAFTGSARVDIDFDKDGGVAFSLPDFDRDNPANYKWRGYFEDIYRVQGAGWQWRGDVELDTNISLFPRLQVGLRWTDRDASLRRGNRYAGGRGLIENQNIPLANTPAGELQITEDAFRGNAQGWTGWLMPTRDGIANNAAELRQFAVEALQRARALNQTDPADINELNLALQRFSTPDVQLDPLQAFYAKESTYTFYAQTKYEFDIGTWRFDGLIGARMVNTAGKFDGTSSVRFNGVVRQEPRSVRLNYVDVLPNFSLRVRPNDKLQLRFGVTKTRTQPGFGQLNPAIRIEQNTSVVDPNLPLDPRFSPALGGRPNAFGSGGNADLKPLTSTNYDVTAEYYFTSNASLTGAVFYRDLNGFINNYTTRTIDPVYGLLEISRPENAGAGKIKGVEVGGQTFFSFLPGLLSGFGVQANVTYLDGENRFPANLFANNTGGAEAPFVKIPGLSKWTYNAALFYEKGTVSTRLSWNSRSAFLNNNFVNSRGIYEGEGTMAINRLDFSFNYSPIEEITLTFDAANLLAQPFENYREYDFNGESRRYPRDVRDEGRYFGLGARFRF